MSHSHQPVFNATPVVLILIAVNVGIHVLLILMPVEWASFIATLCAFSPPWLLAILSGVESPYTLLVLFSPVSYAFLHADWLHLFLNMAFLLAFGTAVERRLGRNRFIGLYVVCMLFGAVASVLLFWVTVEQTIMVGASAAISGLFGAVLRLTSRRALFVVFLFILSNVVIGYTGLPGGGGEVRAIAWEAHIGGFLAGFLLLPFFDRGGQPLRWGRT